MVAREKMARYPSFAQFWKRFFGFTRPWSTSSSLLLSGAAVRDWLLLNNGQQQKSQNSWWDTSVDIEVWGTSEELDLWLQLSPVSHWQVLLEYQPQEEPDTKAMDLAKQLGIASPGRFHHARYISSVTVLSNFGSDGMVYLQLVVTKTSTFTSFLSSQPSA